MTRLTLFRWIALGCLCCALVVGCQPSSFQLPDRWQTYRNPRYGFEFLYPEGWLASIPPENQDGISFSDPRNPAVEIRGWANAPQTPSKERRRRGAIRISPSPQPINFSTEQGLASNLQVDIDRKTSALNLTLTQGGIQYHWRGVAPSQQFGDYYRFFYYVASRYRIPAKPSTQKP
jgi:hypothetical protein